MAEMDKFKVVRTKTITVVEECYIYAWTPQDAERVSNEEGQLQHCKWGRISKDCESTYEEEDVQDESNLH